MQDAPRNGIEEWPLWVTAIKPSGDEEQLPRGGLGNIDGSQRSRNTVKGSFEVERDLYPGLRVVA